MHVTYTLTAIFIGMLAMLIWTAGDGGLIGGIAAYVVAGYVAFGGCVLRRVALQPGRS
tara:strand:+ start:1000 stop:1173 length:174 start_codon:yes stop_codon:yes gene_type:complete